MGGRELYHALLSKEASSEGVAEAWCLNWELQAQTPGNSQSKAQGPGNSRPEVQPERNSSIIGASLWECWQGFT